MNKLRKTLVYAGLEKEETDALLPEALEENGRFLRVYSSITALVFVLCLIVCLIAGGELEINKPIYITMVIANFVLYACARFLIPANPQNTTPYCVIYILFLYGYSFYVSLVHREMPGSAAIAIMLVMPAIFNYRPIYMILTTIAAEAVYCVLSACIKPHHIAMLDLWNALFFGFIANMLSVYLMRVKFRGLLQKQENKRLSETDLLTGVRNRNCFETAQSQYAETCQKTLTLVFIDANGLHDLNNTHGHETGDVMLRVVASALADYFGSENTYRIGGDEFVAICTDRDEAEITDNVEKIRRRVEKSGYSISAGIATEEKPNLNMKRIVRCAEERMYLEKKEYYEQGGHDRRSHA